jgi:hypothetical protein
MPIDKAGPAIMTRSSRPAGRPDQPDPNAQTDNRSADGRSDGGARPEAPGADASAPVWVRRLARTLATTPERLLDTGAQEAPPLDRGPDQADALGQARRLGPGAEAALMLRRRAQNAARRTRTAAE